MEKERPSLSGSGLIVNLNTTPNSKLLSVAYKELIKVGQHEEAEQMVSKFNKADSFWEQLAAINRYVEIF